MLKWFINKYAKNHINSWLIDRTEMSLYFPSHNKQHVALILSGKCQTFGFVNNERQMTE